MGKLIKEIFIRISGEDLTSIFGPKPNRRYAKPSMPLDFPRSPQEAMERDMRKIGADMNAALNRVNE